MHFFFYVFDPESMNLPWQVHFRWTDEYSIYPTFYLLCYYFSHLPGLKIVTQYKICEHSTYGFVDPGKIALDNWNIQHVLDGVCSLVITLIDSASKAQSRSGSRVLPLGQRHKPWKKQVNMDTMKMMQRI